MNKPIIFISHISEEADLATAFKAAITKDFLGLPDVSRPQWPRHAFFSSFVAVLRSDGRGFTSRLEQRGDEEHEFFEDRSRLLYPLDQSHAIPVFELVTCRCRLACFRRSKQVKRAGYSRFIPELHNALTAKSLPVHSMTYLPKSSVSRTFTLKPTKDAEAWRRMKETLSETKHKWRSIERLASRGGVTEDEALEILGRQKDVVFSKGKSGKRIARLQTNEG